MLLLQRITAGGGEFVKPAAWDVIRDEEAGGTECKRRNLRAISPNTQRIARNAGKTLGLRAIAGIAGLRLFVNGAPDVRAVARICERAPALQCASSAASVRTKSCECANPAPAESR